MAVYEHSRYSGQNVYYDKDEKSTYLDFPTTSMDGKSDDFIYQTSEGETLEFLANQFYNDTQLKWVILYANPQYMTELDIKAGDILVIPSRERVMDYVNGTE